jgi:hypothetical protein
MADKPPLTLVGSIPTHVAPPATLGEPGRRLWQTIMNEYDIQDAGGLEVLAQICAIQDRVENLKTAIDRDGETIKTRNGPRAHPALRDELQGRALICRLLERLGLTVEGVRPVGRPPRGSYAD